MLTVAIVLAGSFLGAAPPPGSDDSSMSPGPANVREAGRRGLVSIQGKWVTPDEVVEADRHDTRLGKIRAEYAKLRERTPETAEGQRALALWCEQNGLKAESLAHFLVVTRLDSTDIDARQRLGMRYVRGSWRMGAEIAAEAIELEAQEKADQLWFSKVATLKKRLANPEHKDESVRALAEIHDPQRHPCLAAPFGDRTPGNRSGPSG